MRYIVDERSACAAIIDSFYPFDSPEWHKDSPHVCIFAYIPKSGEIRDKQLEWLKHKCNTYNEENRFTKEQVMELRRKLTNVALELKEVFALSREYSSRNLRDLLT